MAFGFRMTATAFKKPDGWMDGWMDRWMDGWMDGRMDRWMYGFDSAPRISNTENKTKFSALKLQTQFLKYELRTRTSHLPCSLHVKALNPLTK